MKKRPIVYSEQELAFVKENCTLVIGVLTDQFNSRFKRSVSAANINALRKRNKWRTGRTGYFQKGHVPHPNCRPKGPNKTSFKKGNKPSNYLPVGTERVNSDGYIEIKVAEGVNQWRSKARILWEQSNPPLKPGDVLRFKDGNKLNCQLLNLEKFSRSEHVRLNQMHYNDMPGDMKPVILNIARIQAKAGQLNNDGCSPITEGGK